MSSKSNDNIEYVYYEEREVVEDEYVYSEEPENDEVEYVLASHSVPKDSKSKENNPSRANKPGHCKTIPNLYDELDYDISPRATSITRIDNIENNRVVRSDSGDEKSRGFTVNFTISKKTLVVSCILILLIIGAVITGVVVSLQGMNFCIIYLK